MKSLIKRSWEHQWIDVRSGKRVLVVTHYIFKGRKIIKEIEHSVTPL